MQPEYPLAHVLNLLTTHERFIGEDIQDLLDSNGFSHIDAVVGSSLARAPHHLLTPCDLRRSSPPSSSPLSPPASALISLSFSPYLLS